MNEKKVMSAQEVAKLLNVTRPTVYNWLKKGLPYTIKIQGMRDIKQFDIDEVKQWLADQRRKES